MHRFNGAYLHVGGAASADRIERAIAYAITHMGALKGSIAGKLLREKNHVYPRFQVYFEEGRVLMRINRKELDLPSSGRFVHAGGVEGAPVRASARVQGTTLIHAFRSDRGTRYHRFEFHEDGRVVLDVLIESKHLPMAVHYKLYYKRAS